MKIFATSEIHGNKALVYLISQIAKKENIDCFGTIEGTRLIQEG